MRPKISVIVPIYNAELYLEQCIESVLNQTLRDIELLLIDDGSTDNSFLICEKYKKRDNRIQLYTNKNVGQGLERNFGIKKSTGEYIAFLDSDDQYKENMLEKLYQRAIETNADMVSCRIVDMHDGKIIKEHPLNDKVLIGCKEIKAAMADMISYEEKDGYSGCIAIWDSIFKRDIIENEGIQFFSERDVYSEDLLFKLMFMTHAKKIAFCTEAVYLYRVNDTSFTHRIDVSVLKRIVNLYNEVCILFGDVLKDYNLKRRIINRTFFTLRFNINKISKTRNAKDFYRILLNDQEISYMADEITEEQYRAEVLDYEEAHRELNEQLTAIMENTTVWERALSLRNPWIQQMEQYKTPEALDRNFVKKYIEQVVVTFLGDRQAEIGLTMKTEEWKQMLERIELEGTEDGTKK